MTPATPDSSESKLKRANLRVLQFANSTSGHGYKNVAESGSTIQTALWALLLTGAICGLSYHLALISIKYFAYQKRVITNTVLEPLHFPKVTICHTTYFSNYLMAQPGNWMVRDLHSQLFNLTAPYFGVAEEDRREAVADKALLDAYLEGRLPELVNVTAALESVLLTCTFNWRPCSAANFSAVASDRYGICYVFEPNANYAFAYGGYDNGLTLTLAYEGLKDNYFSTTVRYTRGYALLLTPFDKFTNFFRAAPVAAPAGHRTDIGLLVQRTKRKSTINDPCTRHHQAIDFDGMSDNYDYDTVNCVDMALNTAVKTACNCVTDTLPIPPELQRDRRCSRLNFTRISGTPPQLSAFDQLMLDKNCVSNQLLMNDDLTVYGRLVLSCQKACKEEGVVAHSATTALPATQASGGSGNQWTTDVERLLVQAWQRAPDRSFVPALVNVSGGGRMNSGVSASDNVVQVNVYFLSSTVTLFEEDWQYPIESFLSEAGGVIGLWVGASVLTMLEFVELLTGLVAIALNWRSSKCHVAAQTDSTELVETATVDKPAISEKQ